MIRNVLAPFTAVAILATTTYAAEITDPGRVDQVTVYGDRASVKRVIRADFSKGDHTLFIPGVPYTADEASLRVTATGSTAINLSNVRVAPVELSQPSDPKEAAVNDKIEKLKKELARLEYRMNARKEQLKFIEKLGGSDKDKKSQQSMPISKPTVADLGKLLDFIYARSLEAGNGMLEAQAEQEKIKKEIDKLGRELANLKSRSGKGYKTVAVDFSADDKGKGTFIAEYITPGAGWTPEYIVRAAADKNEVRLSYAAMISQRTGEDWPEAKLALSTARPSVGARAPEIEPWYVNLFQSAPRHQAKSSKAIPEQAAMQALGAPQPAAAPAAADEMLEAKTETAAVHSSDTSVTFDAPKRSTVRSGGEKTMAQLADFTFKAEKAYMAVPKYSPNVFMKVKFSAPDDFPIAAGEANVFIGDSFVGKGKIKAASSGAEVELFMGADEGFRIERKLIKKETGGEGLVARKAAVRYVYEITVENYKKSAQSVEVKDHLPYPGSEEISLSNVKLEPKPEKRDERNIVFWKLDVKPKEKKKIRMEFTLEYPKGSDISGLWWE
ncbi:MAG: mucoidy inhibitor MuiA family protein [Nitrospinae bacterium]|nr:mucoidy inhibitor MuiA family protein [Nitrospinota bacterium]